MQIPELKKTVLNKFINVFGWKTKRRIIVIESDDWGSIRMPSKEVYQSLLKAGVPVDQDPYNRYDSLASESDLANLFEVLSAFKDRYGNHPVFTANCTVVNPDFEKIKSSGFQEYHYELFTETLKKYPGHANSFELWQQGISQKLFYPQFHGREHLNINRWMNALKQDSKITRLAFDIGLFGIKTEMSHNIRSSYLAALDFDSGSEAANLKIILTEGLNLFEQLFGYRADSFIAPCYTWSRSFEPVLFNAGIRYLKGNFIQAEPVHSSGNIKFNKLYHYIGQSNKSGQYYLIRNCEFEPGQNENIDWVNYCLCRIDNAFKWQKPASISTHRLNYIGFIDHTNTDRNLPLLKNLFYEILKRWPDVEFMTSSQLGNLIGSKAIEILPVS
ncbi:MAG: hypothetical protein P4L27_08950 [Ignavibacteriaceae bacterium]|nr:hypothetical protein [Ignavibacteriaceae bacterium]